MCLPLLHCIWRWFVSPRSVQPVVITAAHVVHANWSTNATAFSFIFAVSESGKNHFQCTVRRSFVNPLDANNTDLALLSCNNTDTGITLDSLLGEHALLAAYDTARLWQPLVFGGFVNSAPADRTLRRLQLFDGGGGNNVSGSFFIARASATLASAGARQLTASFLQSDGGSPIDTAGVSSASADAVNMLDARWPHGCSGGPIIGKQCEVYGVGHGYGVHGIYTTLLLLRESCNAHPRPDYCPVAEVLLLPSGVTTPQ